MSGEYGRTLEKRGVPGEGGLLNSLRTRERKLRWFVAWSWNEATFMGSVGSSF